MKHKQDSGHKEYQNYCAAVHTNFLKVLDICLLHSLLQVKLLVEAILLSLIIVSRNCRCIASENDDLGQLKHLPKFHSIVTGDFKVHVKISIKQSCFSKRGISFA